MANFTTHIAVGTIVSGALATLTLAADVVAPENLVAVTMAGVLGSVMPDIDLKDSRPSRAMFSGLAVFFSFVVLFNLPPVYSIAEMWLLWFGTLVLVRYVAHAIFHRMSYHRGIYRSLLAALFFGFLTAAVYRHALGRHEGVAWLAAAFMIAGYLTHLVLDEIYSVDVMDTRVKASFGTAVKPIDAKHLGHSAAMAIATVLVFLVTPSTKTFFTGMSDKPMWTSLSQRLLPPDGKWFSVGSELKRRMAEQAAPSAAEPPKAPAATSGINTGSIAPAPAAPTGHDVRR